MANTCIEKAKANDPASMTLRVEDFRRPTCKDHCPLLIQPRGKGDMGKGIQGLQGHISAPESCYDSRKILLLLQQNELSDVSCRVIGTRLPTSYENPLAEYEF